MTCTPRRILRLRAAAALPLIALLVTASPPGFALAITSCGVLLGGVANTLPPRNVYGPGVFLSCSANFEREVRAERSDPFASSALALGEMRASTALGNQQDAWVLDGEAASRATATANGGLVGSGGNPLFYSLTATTSAFTDSFFAVMVNRGEAFRYDLTVTLWGDANETMDVPFARLLLQATGSEPVTYYLSGYFSATNTETFYVRGRSGSLADVAVGGLVGYRNAISSGGVSYRLVLTPVPVPAAVVLLFSGLAAVRLGLGRRGNPRSHR